MSSVYSGCLLSMALVFTAAHAPTLQLTPGDTAAALHREYAEEGELKRFGLDELFLPSLDVSLPELFDWSDIHRVYLADVGVAREAPGFARDTSLDWPNKQSRFDFEWQ